MADSKPTAAELRSVLGGVYMIASWYEDDGEEVQPPLASGRWVVVDGQIVSLLSKTNRDSSTHVQALFGRYTMEDGAFSYGYDAGWQISRAPDGSTDMSEIRMDHLNEFEATRDGDAIRLRTPDGRLGFRATAGAVEFLDNGRLRRVWKRLDATH